MSYDTNDDPAEHDCAWFEEEVQRLRAKLARARARAGKLRAVLADYHKAADSISYAQWTPEMHRAEEVLAEKD